MDFQVKILKNPYFLAVSSAVLLRLSFPLFNLWITAWLAPVLFFLALERQRWPKVLFISFLWGFVFFLLLIFWLHHVTVAGLLLLSAYLSLYTVCFAAGFRLARERMNFWPRLFFLPALWVFLELLRGYLLTGFPWGLLGYSQVSNLASIQAADLTGVYGVSFMVIFVNCFFFEMIKPRPPGVAGGARLLSSARRILPCALVVCWFVYGFWRLSEEPPRTGALKVSLIQGNIAQDIKWVRSFKENILKKYRLLTQIAVLKEDPALVIWPETAFPGYFESGTDSGLEYFAQELRVPFLAGSIRLEDGHYFNSALFFSPAGELRGVYDKLHLVPFGEYIPARGLLKFAQDALPIEDFTPGAGRGLFSVRAQDGGDIRFSVLICFEDIFASLARESVARGADFLVNITNDAWFGDTASPYQHAQASVLRAVENRVFLARAANTGVSCVIDDRGRIVSLVRDAAGKETWVTGQASGFVYKTAGPSFYSKFGDVFAVLCAVYCAFMVFFTLFSKSSGVGILVSVMALFFYFSGHSLAADQGRRDLSLHYYRGVLNFEAGRYENALSEFQTVAAADSRYKDTQYYLESCIAALERAGRLPAKTKPENLEQKSVKKEEQLRAAAELEKETLSIKADPQARKELEYIMEMKAKRRQEREALIREKERGLKEQEELLEEERQDYLVESKISKRAQRLRHESQKWQDMRQRLTEKQAGVTADLMEFPVYLHEADNYYTAMKEALRTSRWNSAGLNAIRASIFYCDALLIYFHGLKSLSPGHDNIDTLLKLYVKYDGAQEESARMRSILNLKKIIEAADRPITRSEAVFLADHTEKIAAWCRSVLP